MIRRILMFIALMMMLSLALVLAPANAEPGEQGGGLNITITTRAWLRVGPGTEWRRLGTLEPGTPLRIDGHAINGLWVRGIAPNGEIGWVATQLTSTTPAQVFTSLPSIWVDTPFGLAAPASAAPPPAPVQTAPQTGQQQVQPAQVAPSGAGTVAVATARVSVRSGPGTNFQRFTVLNVGTPVRIDGRDASGSWVRGTIPDGTVGWIFAQYLSISSGQIAALGGTSGGATQAQAAAPAPAARAPVIVNSSPPPRGFSLGGHVQNFGQGAVNRMRQSGMTWVKRQWRYQDGQNPGAVAGMINDAHAKGFRILLGIVGRPGQVNSPGYFERYAAFVGGVARLGADGIEVWNEMNIDREWPSGSIDPGRYTQMLRLAFQSIKANNPNTMVITGAPAPTGFFQGCHPGGCDDAPYIRGMAAAGAANFADCIGVHYNEGIVPPSQTSGDPRGNSGHYTRYFQGMMNTYSGAFGGARPLCFTELGYLTGEGFPPLPGGFAWAGGTSLGEQAAWLDQAVSMAARSGRVNMLIIWNVDFVNYGADPQAGYAMIRPNGSCPACDALAR